jgi:hypothetical protein
MATTYFEYAADGVEICDVKYGGLKSGRIKLETRMTDATIRRISDGPWKDLYRTQWAVQAGISVLAPFWHHIDFAFEGYEDLLYESDTNCVSGGDSGCGNYEAERYSRLLGRSIGCEIRNARFGASL